MHAITFRPSSLHPLDTSSPKILSLFYVSFIFRAVSVEALKASTPVSLIFKSNNICGMMGRCEYKNLYIGYVSHSVGNASGYISCLTRARRPQTQRLCCRGERIAGLHSRQSKVFSLRQCIESFSRLISTGMSFFTGIHIFLTKIKYCFQPVKGTIRYFLNFVPLFFKILLQLVFLYRLHVSCNPTGRTLYRVLPTPQRLITCPHAPGQTNRYRQPQCRVHA